MFCQVANLLNLEVDLLFFDTTSTYFELDDEDEAVPRDKNGNATEDEQTGGRGQAGGFRAYGKSKDHRDDLPQIVIGMAVTRAGIPVRVWCWPGNTSDSALIRQVKDDMRDWTLARVVWVADRGFTSAENRRYLRRAATTTSSARSCAPAPPRRPPRCPGRAATRTSPRTCGSRKSRSATTSGS